MLIPNILVLQAKLYLASDQRMGVASEPIKPRCGVIENPVPDNAVLKGVHLRSTEKQHMSSSQPNICGSFVSKISFLLLEN